MTHLNEFMRKAFCAMYVNSHNPVPRHLMPEPGNTHRRYEAEKEALPPMPAEEYDAARKNIENSLNL